MKANLKKMIALFLALIMVFALVACAAKEEAPAADQEAPKDAAEGNFAVPEDSNKIYFGVVKHMTGDNQLAGAYAKQSCEMAMEEINAAGGILGKQIELVYIDEGDGSIDQTVNAMSYALEDERLSVMLFGQMTGNVVPALELLDIAEKPIPTLTGNSGQAQSNKGAHPYAWQTRQLDGSGGTDRITALENLYEFDNVVILYPETTSSLESAASWRADFQTKGYEIPDDSYIGYSEKETNFVPYAQKVKSIDPDVIVITGAEPDMARVVTALYEAGLKEKVWVGNNTITSAVVTGSAGEATIGIYSYADWCATIDSEQNLEFVEKFTEKYDVPPCNTNAVYYDQMYLFKYAIEQAGDCYDRDAIRDALNNVKDLDLVLGNYTCNTNRNSFVHELYFVQINEEYQAEYISTLQFEDTPAQEG